jgi:hypothetical protein
LVCIRHNFHLCLCVVVARLRADLVTPKLDKDITPLDGVLLVYSSCLSAKAFATRGLEPLVTDLLQARMHQG